ncbi:MAG: hypothetical protein ABIH34_00785 [Nanoarchaeota archaeon]
MTLERLEDYLKKIHEALAEISPEDDQRFMNELGITDNYRILIDLPYDKAQTWLAGIDQISREDEPSRTITRYLFDPGTACVELLDKPLMIKPSGKDSDWQIQQFQSTLQFHWYQGDDIEFTKWPGKKMDGEGNRRPLAMAIRNVLSQIKEDGIKAYIQRAPYEEPAVDKGKGIFFNP